MTSNTRKIALPVIAALMAVGMLVVATTASAVHSRPKAGTPFLVPLVMAFKQCGGAAGAPTGSHLGGLPFPSCAAHNYTTGDANTGGQISPNITVGTPTSTTTPAAGAGTATRANSVNHALLCIPNTPTALCGAFHTGVLNPGPGGTPPNGVNPPFPGSPPSTTSGYDNPAPTNDDVEIEAVIFDVRCMNAPARLPPSGVQAGTCAPAGSNGPQTTTDYTGEIQGTASIRITDENNTAAAVGGTTHATMVDIPFSVTGTCREYAGLDGGAPALNQGGTCLADTSANAVAPGAAVAGVLGNVEIGQLTINDGGTDGVVSTPGNSTFMTQGIFIP